jgi:hypothetical protein
MQPGFVFVLWCGPVVDDTLEDASAIDRSRRAKICAGLGWNLRCAGGLARNTKCSVGTFHGVFLAQNPSIPDGEPDQLNSERDALH